MNLKSRVSLSMAVVITLVLSIGNFVFSQKTKSSLLWKIEGKGISSPSYLFGTIHMICSENFLMPDPVKEAIKSSGLVFLEMDMDDSVKMAGLQSMIFNPGMTNFSTTISDEDSITIDIFFRKNFGAGLDRLGVMKPFALMTMLYSKYLNCAAPSSYEQALIELAKSNNLEIQGLETPEFQMGLFDNIPQEEIVQWLIDGIDIEKNKKMMGEMTEIYLTGDVDGLFDFTRKASPEFKAYEKPLLTDRNKNWIPMIIENAQKQPTFFGVGAGHLGGKKGVIQLLKKEGYKVTPINLQ